MLVRGITTVMKVVGGGQAHIFRCRSIWCPTGMAYGSSGVRKGLFCDFCPHGALDAKALQYTFCLVLRALQLLYERFCRMRKKSVFQILPLLSAGSGENQACHEKAEKKLKRMSGSDH